MQIDVLGDGVYTLDMTIELNQKQQNALQHLIEIGHYETAQQFLDEALDAAYTYTDEFRAWAQKRIAAADKDIAAGRTVTLTKKNVHEILQKYREGKLQP